LPVYFGVGSTQVFELGYEGLRTALVAPVELLICNRDEARHLTGEAEVAGQLAALAFDGRVKTVVVTDGASGVHALRDGRRCHVPAYTDPRRPVADDVGAGDCCQATIVAALLRGYPLEGALRAGARQGFEACTGIGATTNLLGGEALRDYLSLDAAA
jgi:ribokinase